jgi:hypothetical protein
MMAHIPRSPSSVPKQMIYLSQRQQKVSTSKKRLRIPGTKSKRRKGRRRSSRSKSSSSGMRKRYMPVLWTLSRMKFVIGKSSTASCGVAGLFMPPPPPRSPAIRGSDCPSHQAAARTAGLLIPTTRISPTQKTPVVATRTMAS